MEKFYTPEEISEQLKVHLQTILSYIREGKIKAVKLDKGYRISESDFQAFIHGSRVAKTPEDYLLQLGIQRKYKAFRKTLIKPAVGLIKPIPNHLLVDKLEQSSVRDHQGYRAFPFPGSSIMSEEQGREFDGILLQKEIFAGLFFFAFAATNGELLTAESLWEDAPDSRYPNSIGFLTSLGIMYRGLVFIPRYYKDILPPDGEVNYSFIVDRPRGRSLVMDSMMPTIWSGGYIATTEDPIIIERKVKASINVEEAKEILYGMTKDFLWYFKCDFLTEEVINDRIEEIAKNVITQ